MGSKYFQKLLKQDINEFYISDARVCSQVDSDSPVLSWAAQQVVRGTIKLEQLDYEDNTLVINII